MSNELATLDSFAAGLELVARVELNRGAAGGLPILKLTKGGDWEYGREGIEADPASVWAWNPLSMQHGWVSWGDGVKEGEWMGPISKPLIALDALPPTPGGEWQRQFSVSLLCVAGPDKDEAVTYVGTSSGLLDAFGEMVKSISRQLRAKEPFVPLVKLGVTNYVHKKYGKIWKPSIEVIAWVAQDASPEELETAAAVE